MPRSGSSFPPLAEASAERDGPYKDRGYEPLVAMLRTGPPWMHRTGPLATANVNENFIHHEDVRRASGEGPRLIGDEMDAILWRMLGFGARMSKKAVKGAALTLRTPDGRERVGVDRRRRPVTMTGELRRARAVHVGAQGGRRRRARR